LCLALFWHTASGTNITEIEWVPYAFIVEEGSLVPVKVAVTDCTQEVMSVVIMLLLSSRYTNFFYINSLQPIGNYLYHLFLRVSSYAFLCEAFI
jgi:hypothetical protein